jgi:anti-sigma factor RsiW
MLNRLSRYIDNELTPGQRKAIQTHCRDCARCRRMIAGLRRTVKSYRHMGAAAMPAAIRARARARIGKLVG